MLGALLIFLIILWFLGYIHISGLYIPDLTLFTINGQPITFVKLLIALVIFAMLGMLPKAIRQVAIVLFILWILSVLGIIVVAGLSNILLIVMIIALAYAVLRKL